MLDITLHTTTSSVYIQIIFTWEAKTYQLSWKCEFCAFAKVVVILNKYYFKTNCLFSGSNPVVSNTWKGQFCRRHSYKRQGGLYSDPCPFLQPPWLSRRPGQRRRRLRSGCHGKNRHLSEGVTAGVSQVYQRRTCIPPWSEAANWSLAPPFPSTRAGKLQLACWGLGVPAALRGPGRQLAQGRVVCLRQLESSEGFALSSSASTGPESAVRDCQESRHDGVWFPSLFGVSEFQTKCIQFPKSKQGFSLGDSPLLLSPSLSACRAPAASAASEAVCW